jgi:hypothetical protein
MVSDNALTATRVVDEVRAAVGPGYCLPGIYEFYEFEETQEISSEGRGRAFPPIHRHDSQFEG